MKVRTWFSPELRNDWFILLRQIGLTVWVGIIFTLFRDYDWGHPLIKLGCFFSIFVVVIGLSKSAPISLKSTSMDVISSILFGLGVLFFVSIYAFKYLPFFLKPLGSDIGSTTRDAAALLFQHFKNPYSVPTLAVEPSLPAFGGFHYGPMMLFGYGLSVLFPDFGIRFSNLICMAISLFVVSKLISTNEIGTRGIAGILFALLIAVLPEVIWSEIFRGGVTDVFPVALLLLSFLFVDRENWFIAGLMAGLSFSSKISPAIIFIFLFLRKNVKIQFFVGLAVGFIPCLLFMAWDFIGIIKNNFVFAMVKHYDSTSLYGMIPKNTQFIFPLIQWGTIFFFIARNFYKEIVLKSLVRDFMLMLIIVEVTYKQIHLNHLIWFIYPMALICGWSCRRSEVTS